MSANLKKWRDSATLILAAKQAIRPSKSDFCNYKILTLKRSARTSFFPATHVYPGGTLDKADCSHDWFALFKKFGFNEKSFDIFNQVKYKAPIFENIDKTTIAKSVSLRICAIRETFEECGVLLCKNNKDESDTNMTTYFELKDLYEWQKRVHNDPTKFIELCYKFNIYPDIWALHEWCNWLTPSAMKRRFDTIFFLAALQNMPPTLPEKKEVEEVTWGDPYSMLEKNRKGEIFLPPPQFYEFSRLINFTNLDELVNFSQNRAKNGVQRFLPFRIGTEKTEATILPGDDSYPGAEVAEIPNTHVYESFPEGKIMNRIFHPTTSENKLYASNYVPEVEHIIPVSLDEIKSKL